MALPIVENVVKQGYLKKGNSGGSRLSGFFRRNDGNKWFVFTIRQGMPFLEYYDHDVDMFTQQPINSFNLSNCQNVKSMGNTNPPSFCIVCADRVIELVASSRTQMIEWVNEVEASLIRLGVLRNEAVDHVYTVCPAVVRKPRVSKEVQEEREAEAAAAATTASESRASANGISSQASSSGLLSPTESSQRPPVLPRSSPTHQRSLSVKPISAPRNASALRSTPSVYTSSPSAHIAEETPPPLPLRPPPSQHHQGGAGATSEEPAAAANTSDLAHYHAITGSSNDSDFVSAEVIAELRHAHESVRSKSGRESSENYAENEVGASLESAESVERLSFAELISQSALKSSIPESPKGDKKPELKPKPHTFKSSKSTAAAANVNDVSSSFEQVSCSPLSPSSTDSSTPNSILDISSVERSTVENDYSALPSQTEASSSAHCDMGGAHDDFMACLSKPTPMPRRALSKKCSTSDDATPEVPNITLDNVVDAHDMALSENTCSIISAEAHKSETNEYTELKSVAAENEYTTAPENQAGNQKIGESQATEKLNKEVVHDSSKDENENFYGLAYDDSSPPTSMAPPIPPLPPRHDSLTAWSDGNKPNAPPPQQTRSSYPDTGTSSTTSLLTVSLQNGEDDAPKEFAPPLPRPRRKEPNSDLFQKSHSTSAFTSPSEIPPMPPKRPPPQRSLTHEERPPALPNRNSQSFIIKRPQITSMPVNMAGSEDDPVWKKRSSGGDCSESGEGRGQDSGASNGASGLSRKMLLDRAHSLHTVVSLKQTQAEILQTEISMSSVSVTLTQKSGHGLALVEWNDFPCVVGWNQKDFPSLHGKLHIGDLLFSVNNVKVTSPDVAQKLLKQATTSKIDIMLHRMPYAKVFAIRRNAEGQSLGIKRDGGSGEIVYVDPNGLAAQHGLTQHAQSVTGGTRCNWFITEINNRPLNLFFKENEIDHRLQAVGREISIVVQPCDFIYEIRRQFKKLRNYKSYITQ